MPNEYLIAQLQDIQESLQQLVQQRPYAIDTIATVNIARLLGLLAASFLELEQQNQIRTIVDLYSKCLTIGDGQTN
jgi:hypothetical protein